MAYLGASATCRISFAPYNTTDEVDARVEALEEAPRMIARSVLKKGK